MEKNKWHAFLFLLPSIFFFVVFSYWPLLQNLYLSFFSWNMVSPNMTFVGIENYTAVLGSEELIKILANTVVFVAIMLVLNFVLPYLFSFVLGHLIERGKGFYRSTLFMPATLSLAVASILFPCSCKHPVPVDLQPAGWPVKHCAFVVRFGIAALV